jgi:transposase
VIVDAGGIPLALLPSPANLHDSRLFAPLLDVVPPGAARERNITPRIARRGVEGSRRLGGHRWVIERTLAWFARFRRLTVRCERRLAGSARRPPARRLPDLPPVRRAVAPKAF